MIFLELILFYNAAHFAYFTAAIEIRGHNCTDSEWNVVNLSVHDNALISQISMQS
jgi:hypothetical protein